jgi:hypothetical protein
MAANKGSGLRAGERFVRTFLIVPVKECLPFYFLDSLLVLAALWVDCSIILRLEMLEDLHPRFLPLEF